MKKLLLVPLLLLGIQAILWAQTVSINAPTSLALSGSFITEITYTDVPEEYELLFTLKKGDWTHVVSTSEFVSGSGTSSFELTIPETLEPGEHILHAEVLESRDPWVKVTEDYVIINALAGDTPFVALSTPSELPLEGSFDVDLSYLNLPEGAQCLVSLKTGSWEWITGIYTDVAGDSSQTITLTIPEPLAPFSEYIIQAEVLTSVDPWVKFIETHTRVPSAAYEGDPIIELDLKTKILPKRQGFLVGINYQYVFAPMKATLDLIHFKTKKVVVSQTAWLGGFDGSPKIYMDLSDKTLSSGIYILRGTFERDGKVQELQEYVGLGSRRPQFKPYEGGFYTEDGKLYDENDKEFIFRGINNAHVWWDNSGRLLAYNSLDTIADYGTNSVRIVWRKGINDIEADFLWEVVKKVVDLKMIPVIELHDGTGKNDPGLLLELANYWAEHTEEINQYGKYIIVNIANEWGDWFMASPDHDPDVSEWYEAYKKAITTMRSAGIQTTIMIDGPMWGQDIRAIKTYAEDLMAHDPLHNLIFSVHMYCNWADDNFIEEQLADVKESNIPLAIGEFGFQHPEGGTVCEINEDLILEKCEELGIGWLAWSWSGNGGGVEFLDIADWNNNNELSEWGKTVLLSENGIQKTSKISSLFEDTPDDNDKPKKKLICIMYPSLVKKAGDLNFKLLHEASTLNIQISDYFGSPVLEKEYKNVKKVAFPIKLPTGFYYVKISTEYGTITKRCLVR